MKNTLLSIFHYIILVCFYLLFFLTPFMFASNTSELFEFNKMWTVYILTILIGASWLSKMVLAKDFRIQKTPLDFPILLFVLSQVIATVYSLDTHVSLWGYYSRFNGGLLSVLSYVTLYYAFVSNFIETNESYERGTKFAQDDKRIATVKRLLIVSLVSGTMVALWGLPSHFGYDPTCLLFRGKLNVECWTDQFKPTVRIFSTLGQPNWLAAYLAILIPIALAFATTNSKSETRNPKQNLNNKNSKQFEHSNLKIWNLFRNSKFRFSAFSVLIALLYICLLFTLSQSGFVGLWVGIAFFLLFFFLFTAKQCNYKIPTLIKNKSVKLVFFTMFLLLITTFFVDIPIWQLQQYTFSNLKERYTQPSQITSVPTVTTTTQSAVSPTPVPNKQESAATFETGGGGTDSSKIRLHVWQGAIDAWKQNIFFGTGLETFAFAYYRFKPTGHNLTSEWDYLYNKAHNEYLNFLATTGSVGLGTYLFMIVWFLILSLKNILNGKWQIENGKLLSGALLASYLSILISNFFGFAVVIVNVYFFLIPAFIFVLLGMLQPSQRYGYVLSTQIKSAKHSNEVSGISWTVVLMISVISLYWIYLLIRFWVADTNYAYGYNLNRVSQYQTAYSFLQKAVLLRGDEPVFKDELAYNAVVLALYAINQKKQDEANAFLQQGITLSDEVIREHPNNVVFWKTRVRILYALSQADPSYLPPALEAIKKAHALAPTDAKIAYNLGVLYGQNKKTDEAIQMLEKTIQLKPNYQEAYYALGLFYREKALNKNGQVVNLDYQKKAADTMRLILNNFSKDDQQAQEALKTWGEIVR